MVRVKAVGKRPATASVSEVRVSADSNTTPHDNDAMPTAAVFAVARAQCVAPPNDACYNKHAAVALLILILSVERHDLERFSYLLLALKHET